MADIDWVADAGTVISSSWTGNLAVQHPAGSEASCYDQNDATYWEGQRGGYGNTAQWSNLVFTATFSTAVLINRLKLVHGEYYVLCNNPVNSWTLEYQDGSGWHTQGTGSNGVVGIGPSAHQQDYTGLNLTGVTAVRCTLYSYYATATTPSPPPFTPGRCGSGLYELWAYGPEGGGPSGNAMLFGTDF
jgi:hypothetical protein